MHWALFKVCQSTSSAQRSDGVYCLLSYLGLSSADWKNVTVSVDVQNHVIRMSVNDVTKVFAIDESGSPTAVPRVSAGRTRDDDDELTKSK